MKFNWPKCCYIQFGVDTPVIKLNIGDQPISVSNSVNSSLKWSNHVQKIAAKANRALGINLPEKQNL